MVTTDPAWPRCDSCDRDTRGKHLLLGIRICDACYAHLRRHPAACLQCGTVRVLAFLDPGGHRICDACAGQPGRFDCKTCGTQEELTGSQCQHCRLHDRLDRMLDNGDGGIRLELRPLKNYLLTAHKPKNINSWLRREPAATTLPSMARGEIPITHRGVDQLPLTASTRYLRRMLISAGVLPEIDVYRHDLDLFVAHFLNELPAEHAAILKRFYRWRMLPTIRRRLQDKDMTISMSKNWRTELRNHQRLLSWLEEHGLTLATADQSAIDKYVSEHAASHSTGAFLTWAAEAGLCADLDAKAQRQHKAAPRLTEAALESIIFKLFDDESVPLPARLVTLFALIYAQPIQRSVVLRRGDIHDVDGQLMICFARTPVQIPARLEKLVRQQLTYLDTHHRTLPGEKDWLFPGVMPDQHISPGRTRDIIAAAGLGVRLLKDSRIQHFAQTVPASVIADITGISVEQANRHAVRAGGTWAGYPASRLSWARGNE